jgi:hypothetical protein
MPRIRRIRYSGDQWKPIAKALGLPRPTQYLKRAVTQAAEEYHWAKTSEKYRLGRAERRWQLEQIIVNAKALEAALRKLDYPTTKLLEAPISVDDITLLVTTVEQAIDRIPKTSGEPKKARLQYVRELARIFEIVTGRRPARRVHDRECGPFHEFVKACLSPIDARATQGVEADIRKAVRRQDATKSAAA